MVDHSRNLVNVWDAEHSDGQGLIATLDALVGVTDTINSCGGKGFHVKSCGFNALTSLPTPLKFGRALKVVDNVGDTARTTKKTVNACGLKSFAGATLVLMADGSQKPIQDIKVGDRVIASDPVAGKQAAKMVGSVGP